MRRLVVGAVLAVVVGAPVSGMRPAAAAPAVKPAIVGLLDRQGIVDDQWAGIIRGVVVQVDWAVLQPTADGPVIGNNPIDAALAAVRAYNGRHPDAPLAIKLRVMAGKGAPQWLKDRVGSQLVQSPVDQGVGTVPFWWRPEVDAVPGAARAAGRPLRRRARDPRSPDRSLHPHLRGAVH